MAKKSKSNYRGMRASISPSRRLHTTQTVQTVKPLLRSHLQKQQRRLERSSRANSNLQTQENAIQATDFARSMSKSPFGMLSICRTRSTRKQVIHAKKKAGRRGQKRAKWKLSSYIRCK